MIPPNVLNGLIKVGNAGKADTPPMLADPRRAWTLLMVGDEPWKAAATKLANDDLVALIRGLVLFSQATGWNGGSVSPVIPLYHEYLDRLLSDEPTFTAWIVEHRRNEYEPFGTIVHGDARTLTEFYRYQVRRSQIAAEGITRDAERKRADARTKADRATKRIAAAVRRGDLKALHALIAVGGDLRRALPPGESLVELARVNERTAMVAFLEGISLGEEPPSGT